jgi:hypothetical protein
MQIETGGTYGADTYDSWFSYKQEAPKGAKPDFTNVFI